MARIFPFFEYENEDQRITTFAQLAQNMGFNKTFARDLHELMKTNKRELFLYTLSTKYD